MRNFSFLITLPVSCSRYESFVRVLVKYVKFKWNTMKKTNSENWESKSMPLRLDIRRELTARSDRIKSVDLHPSEPWVLCSLYSGHVHMWNTQSQTLIKTFEVCDLPVRAAKFVPRKNWVISGQSFFVFFFNWFLKLTKIKI